ncbi:acetyltransferase-like isoleucine patch superfamily enzyme [Mucilaginibacter oryzae]|uniref:Acetyltransferase-like isoleucine patch superfamily enzyme n=1 Tax=Mucilaginibacter oryzae TaxID=468058 RepID=A0A316HDX6_9SPHI|nr:acyltransferase [Mucilaginibacter oryzae]PWK78788.1 acetyltransferase-like isoleucine patch superfamily enzyme [Mucilaginibacter oryzae]
MSIVSSIKSNPKLKKLVHWMLIPSGQSRPRLWVRLILNRFFHHRGKGSVVRFYSRMDLFPFNKFSLGAKSIIEDFAVINNGVGDVFIGEGTGIGIGNVVIGPVKIGNFSMTAQHVVISGLNHGYQDVTISPRHQKVTTKQITIDDNVWIGANCTVTAGVTIGKHSVIGAGSVVTRDIPPYSVAVGNPAKVIKQYNFTTQTWEKA